MTYNIFAALRDRVVVALADLIPDLPAEVAARVEVTPAKDPAHGDMATNAAMVAARSAGMKPTDIAARLVVALAADADIAEAAAAGPGFVNIRLKPSAWQALLPGILRDGEAYGASTVGNGVRVNVEYVSANPTGPLHIGHCRGAVVGDSLANLMTKAGFGVTKEFYINDAGNQITALCWAIYWRYLQAVGTGLTEEEYANEVPGGLQYRGDYLIPVAAALVVAHGNTLATPGKGIAAPDQWLEIVRETGMAMMLASIREDLAVLGVRQDVFSSERALAAQGATDVTIAQLQAKGADLRGHAGAAEGQNPG